MKTVTFSSILNNVAQLVGLDKDNLPSDMFTIVRDSVSHRMAAAWESELWPVLMRISSQTVQTSGSINYIDVESISDYGEALAVYDYHPYETTRLSELSSQIGTVGGNEAVIVRQTGTVYLEYRIARPDLTGDVWSAGTYASGDQVYYSVTGNFYTANTSTSEIPTHADWDVVEIPKFLSVHLIRAAMADYYRANDNEESALIQEAAAERALEVEADKVFRQQAQTRQLNFVR